MTAQELATELNNCEYRREMTKEQEQSAAANDLVVVHGASDDLTEFRGAINDEQGNGELYFDELGQFFEEDELSRSEKATLNFMHTKYYPFTVKTDIPHSTFTVMEDGELYGTGIVFSINDLK
jgi:hypothetical protein